nr:MAG TPA: hypothetical protein [Caudoviricetes sp.]
MSVNMSVKKAANGIISTFLALFQGEWHSRGQRFDPVRLHQDRKSL